jgi:fructokinase
MTKTEMRIGIDLGGTKIEALAIDNEGIELARYRIDTPREDYDATIQAMVGLVRRLEEQTGQTGSVGAGIPGSISRITGVVKNSNSTWLNGRPLDKDLTAALGREVRLANDANCLAVSEATDGAAAGKRLVFAVILGTGCGGGIALDGRVHNGPNGVAGEWGHNPLPWPKPEESPGPACYCGKRGCMEMWVSGTGIALDYKSVTGRTRTTREIVSEFDAGEKDAEDAIDRFEDRLGEASTPILPARYGDSSGVRGAAWLWPNRRD